MQKNRDEELAAKVGAAIKLHILRSGLTRYNVAKRAGISSTCLNAFIQGHSMPSLTTLSRLCAALNVTPNDIL